ncbi:hypothetical protein BJ322DRAFT_891074 [Thelephora terrestris]|uniref:Cx9C motif-containing protein 4, mitochondrial n=1 Tax=Thelephora terrestris TaxID=56493 RepID=A0A9P6L6B1_9AGAM|nr:hypothetical protein BJ322DRAFT_891074 [Thelephora terrestris]
MADTTKTLKPNECQAEACDLQACLGKNTYDPSKCDAQLRKLYECCGNMYDRTNGKGESTACPIPSVVRSTLIGNTSTPVRMYHLETLPSRSTIPRYVVSLRAWASSHRPPAEICFVISDVYCALPALASE